MSRNAARRQFTADDLAAQTAGIECRKDSGVVDEIPAANKDIDSVIADQADLVEVVARLQTLLCIKGQGLIQRRLSLSKAHPQGLRQAQPTGRPFGLEASTGSADG